ncbi:MAG: lipoprotein [Ktedonobacteraceae bacterium]
MLLILLTLLACFLLSACSNATTAPSAPTTSAPQNTSQSTPAAQTQSDTQGTPAARSAQAGDIPDTQAFVTYRSAQGGYQLEVPEGWARTVTGPNVGFSDKFNAVAVEISQVAAAPTVESVRANEAVTLQKTGNVVRDIKVQSVQINNIPIVMLAYTANSDPNAVTGKQIRLENNRYLFFQNGKLATLTLSAALGADNVDQWLRMARSFKWV